MGNGLGLTFALESGMKVEMPDPFAGLIPPVEPLLSSLDHGILDALDGLKVEMPDPLAGLIPARGTTVEQPRPWDIGRARRPEGGDA